MTDLKRRELSDMESFASRHGLKQLSTDNLTRLAELAPRIAQLGSSIPRPPYKSDAPAERSKLSKPSSERR